jgi:hypothetical protein
VAMAAASRWSSRVAVTGGDASAGPMARGEPGAATLTS